MDRKEMMQKIRKMGKARGLLEGILKELKAGNVRVHPLEQKFQEIIQNLDKLFVDFTETFGE